MRTRCIKVMRYNILVNLMIIHTYLGTYILT